MSPAMSSEVVIAAVDQNFFAALKHLDVIIQRKREQQPEELAGLAQLCLNKGYCNQRLQLYRKALKVYSAQLGCYARLQAYLLPVTGFGKSKMP